MLKYGLLLVDCHVTNILYVFLQLKNNPNQRCWLLQKTHHTKSETYGYRSFQEFLDRQQYSRDSILRYEKIFGRTFISTGGLETTKVKQHLQNNCTIELHMYF